MARFLRWWVLCGAIYVPIRLLASYLLVRQVDLRFGAFAELVLVPAGQALALVALAWPRRRREPRASGPYERPWQRLSVVTAAVVFLVVATVPLATSVLLAGSLLDDQGVAAQAARAGVLAAGGLCWLWARRGVGSRLRLVVAGGLLAFAGDALWPWRASLPGLLPESVPLVFRWLATYGPLFVVALMVVLTLAGRLRAAGGEPGPAWLLELASAFAVVAATILLLAHYRRPQLLPATATVVAVLGHLAVAALTSAGALAGVGAAAHAGPERSPKECPENRPEERPPERPKERP